MIKQNLLNKWIGIALILAAGLLPQATITCNDSTLSLVLPQGLFRHCDDDDCDDCDDCGGWYWYDCYDCGWWW